MGEAQPCPPREIHGAEACERAGPAGSKARLERRQATLSVSGVKGARRGLQVAHALALGRARANSGGHRPVVAIGPAMPA